MKAIAAALLVCAIVSGRAWGATRADQPDDGLVRAENSLLEELHVAPNVSLANYQRVMLDPIEVSFKKGWRNDHPEIRNRELKNLRADLAALLHDILVAELARGGYAIAEAPAKDVLRLRAAIVDVELAAPGMNADKSTLVHSDGKMVLEVRGFDGPSGALVARARDHGEDEPTRIVEFSNRVTALNSAKLIFEEWAREVRSALDVAKVSAGARKLQE